MHVLRIHKSVREELICSIRHQETPNIDIKKIGLNSGAMMKDKLYWMRAIVTCDPQHCQQQ